MKKAIAMVLTASMAVAALAGCGSSSSKTSTTSSVVTETGSGAAAATSGTAAASGNSDMKVAMITDYGDITDQSFNQTTYEACKAFCKDNSLEFTYYKPDGNNDSDREAMVDKAVSDGYNVIVMPGYAFAQCLVDESPMYPDVKFIALDVSQDDIDGAENADSYTGDNVYCAIYQEQIPGYMAGYAAVKMGYKKLGFLGGMAVPAVQRYGYGFVQGADEAAKELNETDVEVKYVYGNAFQGNASITATMDTWYSTGTQVVFACGGGIWTSAAEAAAKYSGKIIGVDVDQKGIIDGQYGDGMTITSAMKGLAATVNTLLAAVRDGKWDQYKGQIQNLGLVSGTDMDQNYVGLAEDSTVWTDGFTDDNYKTLVGQLFDGTLKVSDDTTKSASDFATVITVDDQGTLSGS